jgi:Dolichyl-phosphate-mannose-protein mannosyltransferase
MSDRALRALARVTLVAILGLAAWLRVQGLSFGLPAVYNPDELAIMSRALAFAKGDLNPHNFLYPTFYFYVLFAWVGAYFGVAWAIGAVPSIAAFQTQFFVDPSGVYLAGRTLGVVCGVATVGAVHALGRRIGGTPTGLAAALFLAVAPTAVRDAHYVKHDVPVTLVVVLAMLAIVRLASPAGYGLQPAACSLKPLIPAAALTGVAFSTHYYAVFLALPLTLAIVVARRGEGWPGLLRELALAAAVSAIVFFALSPFLLVEPGTAWQDIVANRQIVMDRAVTGGGGTFASATAYARLLWTEALGWPVVVAALAGVGVLWRDRPFIAVLLVAFPLPFLAFISNTVAASRYLNPVLPFAALFAGYAVTRALRGPGASAPGLTDPTRGPGASAPGSPTVPQTPGRKPRGHAVIAVIERAGATVLVSMLLAWPGFNLSYAVGRFFQQTDTRTLAQRYIEAHVPAGATVLIQPYSVQLVQSQASLREALVATGHDPASAPTKFALRLALDPYPAPAYRTIFLGDGGLDADKIYVSARELGRNGDLAPLERLGVQYVVLKRYNTEDLPVAPLRDALVSRGRLVATFAPWRSDAAPRSHALVTPFLHNTDTPYDRALERPGPGIDIWALRAHGNSDQ